MRLLLLTYNSKLKKETCVKRDALGMQDAIDVHTYHSFGFHHYTPECRNDQGLLRLLEEDMPPVAHFGFDMLLCDELQDMTPLLYAFVKKICKDRIHENGQALLWAVFGDAAQSIYGYNGADARFLTMADRVFNVPFTPHRFTQTFRCTQEMCSFLHDVCLGTPELRAAHPTMTSSRSVPGSVEVWVMNAFKHRGLGDCGVMRVCDTIDDLVKNKGYSPEDILVLAPSLRQGEGRRGVDTPVRELARMLTKFHLPIYVPFSDEAGLDDARVLRGKIQFLTFHQAKGLERKVVFVYGVDASYMQYYQRGEDPTTFPNTLYVAFSRAIDKLVVIHHYKKEFLPCMNTERLTPYLQVMHTPKAKAEDASPPTPPPAAPPKALSVTAATRHLNAAVVYRALQRLTFRTVRTADPKPLSVPTIAKQKHTRLHEPVAAVNGCAIPAYFESWCAAARTQDVQLAQLVPPTEEDVAKLLKATVATLADDTGYKHLRDWQIRQWDWLTPAHLTTCVQRLHAAVLGDEEKPQFEVEIAAGNLTGRLDAVVGSSVWEFKCTGELTEDHKLQLAFYAWMVQTVWQQESQPWSFHLYNILNQEHLVLETPMHVLTEVVEDILATKQVAALRLTDDLFVESLI